MFEAIIFNLFEIYDYNGKVVIYIGIDKNIRIVIRKIRSSAMVNILNNIICKNSKRSKNND